MKKIISMLAVLCMLITSMPMIVTADETAGGSTFESTKLMGLNTSATKMGDLLVDKDGKVLSSWPSGSLNIVTETNNSGDTFNSVKISEDSPWFVAADDAGNHKVLNQIMNKTKTTYEFWVKTSNIATGDHNRKNIFYTGTGMNYATQYADGTHQHGIQSLFVRNGKLVYDIAEDKNSKVVGEYDLSQKRSQYVHVVITRALDTTDSENTKIDYTVYFDGKKAGEYTKTSGVESATPDGTMFFFGGFFYDSKNENTKYLGNAPYHFDGNVAEFNVYEDIATQEKVTSLYNENKATYDVPQPFRDSKTVWVNLNRTSDGNTFVKADGNSGSWCYVAPTKTTTQNANGKNISYLEFTGDTNSFMGGDNTSTHVFLNKILNKDQMTVETWLSVDDIMAGEVSIPNKTYGHKDIFYFTKNFYWNNGPKAVWSMFVQNGQLRQTYESGKTACMDIPLADYVGKFIHIVATRNIERTDDGAISKITYQTYFNGKAQTPVVLEAKAGTEATEDTPATEAVVLTTSTEDRFFIGGTYGTDGKDKENAFDGKIAEFNFYDKIMSKEDAEKIYNDEKGKYTLTEKTAEEEYTDFKNAKALYLNKDAIITVEKSGSNYLKIPKDITSWSGKEWMWADGMQSVQTGVNKNGGTYTYYPFTANTRSLLCSNNDNKIIHDVINGRKKLSIEMWIAVDDIMNAGETGYRTIFGTGNYELSNRIWNFVVKGGKLVNSYKNEVIDEIDITGYKSEFVHVVLTRDVDDENNTISFNTYFNGEKQTGKDITVTETDIANIDNNCWIFGDTWSSESNNRFVGKIADIVVYQDVLPTENAATLYNETKDTYASKHVIKVEETAVYCNDEEESSISNLNDILDLDCTQLQVYYRLVNTSARYTKNAMVTLALYDGNKLVDVVTGNVALAPGKSTENLGGSDLPVLTITLPQKDGKVNLSEKSQLKFFVWSTDDGENMQPYEVDDGVHMEWKYLTEEGL